MKTCYLYSVIYPIEVEVISEDDETPALITLPIKLKDGRQWEAAVVGPPDRIAAIRISIPDTDGLKVSKPDYERFKKLRDYFLDCIRLSYEPEAALFHRGDEDFVVFNFREPNESPSMKLQIKEPKNPEFQVNALGLMHLMGAPADIRPVLKLMADGQNFRLPLQFRFLSYFKILELHYKVSANSTFLRLIDPFLPDLRAVTQKDICNSSEACRELKRLRNMCAHVRLQTGEMGFSHPSAETDEIRRAVPLAQRLAVACFRQKYPSSPIRLSSDAAVAEAELLEMEKAGSQPVRIA